MGPLVHAGRARLLACDPRSLQLNRSHVGKPGRFQPGGGEKAGGGQNDSARTQYPLYLIQRDGRARRVEHHQEVDKILGVGEPAMGVQAVDRRRPIQPLLA